MKKKSLEEIIGKELKISKINKVTMDTRELKEGDVFVAIRGGNNHIDEALKKNPLLVICENTKYSNKDNIIVVDDSIEIMQKWAKRYLELKDILTIGITGSNGKTSTKDTIYSFLSKFKKGIKTEGNYNNNIGLPFTVLQIEEEDEFAVLEMGMSNFGEIDLLGEIVKPTFGCITNIGDSHLENVGDRDGVFRAKTELLKYVKEEKFFYGDDLYLKELDGIKVGFDRGNDYIIETYKNLDEGCEFYLKNLGGFKTNLQGKHNILNITMAIAIMEKLGYKIEDYRDIIEKLELTKMRFEKIKIENRLFINDAYNASPVSMKFAIETFKEIYQDKKRILVLGDMLELGGKSRELHENISDSLKENEFFRIYLFGKEMKYLKDIMINNENVVYLEDKRSIQEQILDEKDEVVVLLKGSRGMKLEEIIK